MHNSAGLHKVGTGYGGTIKGFLSASNPAFHSKDQGWLAYAQNKLFYRSLDSVSNTLYVVDRDTLQEVCGFEIEGMYISCYMSKGIHIINESLVYVSRRRYKKPLFLTI